MRYAGDGHDHYHVRRMATYHLWSTSGTLPRHQDRVLLLRHQPALPVLPRAPEQASLLPVRCGSRRSLSTRSGISVGWGDNYPWNFAYQYIDITGLPSGTYTLRAVVDLFGQFTEQYETNNCSYVRLVDQRQLGPRARRLAHLRQRLLVDAVRVGRGVGPSLGTHRRL